MIISRYIDYLDQIVMHVAGCPTAVILNALKQAGRKFCMETEVWRTDLLIDTVDGTSEYTLPLPTSTLLKRIVDAPDIDKGGVRLRNTPLHPEIDFTLGYSEARADEQAPSGALYVVSGAGTIDGESPIGYYIKSAETDEYDVFSGNGIAFRLFSDKLAVRVLLQQTSPTEIDGWKIEGSSNPIGSYTEILGSGAITVAAVSGTTLPAPTINLRSPASTTEENGLSVYAAIIPEHKHDGLPIQLLNDYSEGIIGGALDILLRMPRKPWTDPNMAADFKYDYNTAKNRARAADLTGRRY